MTDAFESIQPLGCYTPTGLFVSTDSEHTPYWVVDRPRGKFAVQLRQGQHRPPFSYVDLQHEAYPIYGRHVGTESLQLGAEMPTGALPFRRRPAIICHQGWRLKIKLVEPGGYVNWKTLGIVRTEEYAIHMVFYERWTLNFDYGGGWTSKLDVSGPQRLFEYQRVEPGPARLPTVLSLVD